MIRRYLAFACDYDGTIAVEGRVDASTLAALERAKRAGWRLVLVTGRALDDLTRVFGPVQTFDRIVAENGALLFTPSSGTARVLAASPPPEFAAELRRRGVTPLSTGQVIVATDRANQQIVADVIRGRSLRVQMSLNVERILNLEMILNKGALMVLPSGVDKASGLKAALADLGLTPEQTVGVGDAENDLTFLDMCGYAVAVSNAVESVKARADLVTANPAGAGVVELVARFPRFLGS